MSATCTVCGNHRPLQDIEIQNDLKPLTTTTSDAVIITPLVSSLAVAPVASAPVVDVVEKSELKPKTTQPDSSLMDSNVSSLQTMVDCVFTNMDPIVQSPNDKTTTTSTSTGTTTSPATISTATQPNMTTTTITDNQNQRSLPTPKKSEPLLALRYLRKYGDNEKCVVLDVDQSIDYHRYVKAPFAKFENLTCHNTGQTFTFEGAEDTLHDTEFFDNNTLYECIVAEINRLKQMHEWFANAPPRPDVYIGNYPYSPDT
jgi:hypothetical protein